MFHHLRVARHNIVTGDECGVTWLLADSAPEKVLSCIAQEEAIGDRLIGTLALDGYASTHCKPTKSVGEGLYDCSNSRHFFVYEVY